MKRLIFSLLALVYLFNSYSQKKLITTSSGNDGAIFQIMDDAQSPVQLAELSYPKVVVYQNLFLYNNRFYGMTEAGGKYNKGTIFSIATDGTDFKKLHDFDEDNGSEPKGTLARRGSILMGLASKGGNNGDGVIFYINPDGSNYQVLHHFNGTDGSNPQGSLLNIGTIAFGMTRAGGANGYGTVFAIDQTLVTLHSFNITDGRDPYGDLVFTQNKLRGMTRIGGDNNMGVIFSVMINGLNFTVDHNFDNETSGRNPYGSLFEDNGKLYGMTKNGGTNDQGVIFVLDDDGTNFDKLHDFTLTTGITPSGNLVLSNNKLWGVTVGGGANSLGSIFSMDTDGTDYTAELDFTGTNGQNPQGSLLAYNNQLWGMSAGGIGSGVVFKIENNGTGYQKMHEFTNVNGVDIRGPVAEIEGKLWGMTYGGGTNSVGTLFKVDKDGSNYEKVYDFSSSSGGNPEGGLVYADNKIWGMTTTGGNHSSGTLFNLDPDGSNYTIAHHFQPTTTNGDNPEGSLLFANGKLYGACQGGGANDHGIIFSIELNGSGFTIIHDFDNTNGRWPNEVIDHGGKLWGMTYQGGTNATGVIFNVNYNGTGFTNEHNFNNMPSEGAMGYGKLTAKDSKLFGMTSTGGDNNGGTIFSITDDGNTFDVIHHFSSAGGSLPQGSLTLSAGRLWGVTYQGGTEGDGVIFSIDDVGSDYTVHKSLDLSLGINPRKTHFISIKNDRELSFSQTNKTYGDANFTLSATSNSSGTINFSSNNTSVVSISGTSASIIGAGEVTLTAYQDEDNSYNYGEAQKTITIGKGSLTITANDLTIKYGSEPDFSLSFDGFEYDDAEDDITTPVISSAYSDVGSYDITLSGGSSDNYDLILKKGTLTVDRTDLTITADDKEIKYGDAIPALTLSFSGFVNDEDVGSISPPSVSTNAGQTGNVGSYDITLSGGSATNYNLIMNNGTLTILKADQTITFEPIAGELDSEVGDFVLNATASTGLPVTFSSSNENIISIEANLATVLGEGEVTITASQVGNENYNSISASQVVKVTGQSEEEEGNEVLGVYPNNDVLVVYPNPTYNHFSISDRLATDFEEIQVHDINGKNLRSFAFSADGTYDISELQSGVLFVMLLSRQRTLTYRIIKRN